MRKEGRKYKAIAKELGVSVSGVQKVWERFLATLFTHIDYLFPHFCWEFDTNRFSSTRRSNFNNALDIFQLL